MTITSPEQAAALPVATTLAAFAVVAVREPDQFPGGQPGWLLNGAPQPFSDGALFEFAHDWDVRA